MHAARLVEYSDSEDDEEHQWRQYHKQRSMLRMPASVGGAASVRGASFQSTSGMDTSPQTPASTAGDQQPHSASSSQSDRDYAFTPRKRSTFLRSTASSSPYARKTSPPTSPQADFSFSYPGSSTSASPMSDGESKPFVWAASPFELQKPRSNGEKFGVTGTDSSPHIFTFGSVKTEHHSDKAANGEDSSKPAPGSAGFESSGPSPFKFDAFFKSVEAKPTTSAAPAAPIFQAPRIDRAGSRDARADSKTPQRQKDLHRAAKRRVSGGGGVGLSDFGGTPSSSVSTPSPFSFVSSNDRDFKADVPNTPARKVLSPMDIQMDESMASSASPAFTFGIRTPPPPAKTSASFAFGSTPKQTSDSSGRPASSRVKRNGVRIRSARVTEGRDDTSREFVDMDVPFVFGSNYSSSFSTKSSFVDPAPPASSFTSTFDSAMHRSNSPTSESKNGPSPPLERKMSSFTFEEAFKEFQNNAHEFKPATHTSSTATSKPDAAREDVSDASPFSASYPSLAARLERRRQAREAQARSTPSSVSSGSDSAPRRAGAQKSLFGSARASEPFPGTAFSDRAPAKSNASTTFNSSSTFAFGGVKPEPKKMTTNVFQKPSRASESSSASTAGTAWSFDLPVSQAQTKKEPVFGSVQFNQGGVFSFGRSSGVPASEPTLPHPPGENLKSNFDGFNLGLGKSKSTKAKPGIRKPVSANGTSADQKVRSPFSMAAPSDVSRTNTSAFVGTPPADPFVTPTFGQKKHAQGQEPKAKQGLDSRFTEFSSSPFATAAPPVSSSFGGFKFGDGGTEQSKPAGKTPSPFNAAFSFASTSSIFGQRRILRAARPAKESQSADANVGAEEATHRKWSDWKLLGGEAYSNREYQQAADCYLNSTNALETLLIVHPELKTDQLMKDKAKLHSNRAAALMMLLQMSDAQRECHLSIESDPGYTRAYLRLGRVQVLMGDVEGAKETAKTAKQLLSLDQGGRNWRDSNDMAGVKKIELGVENLERLLGEIKWCLDVHDYSNALVHLNEALAISPSSRSLQTQKAQVLYDQKNYSQVIDYCVGVIRKQKSNNRSPPRSQSAPASKQPSTDGSKDNDVALLGIELSLLRIRALHHERKEEEAMQHMHKLELAAPVSEKVIQLKRLLHDMKDLKHQANASFKNGDYTKAQQLYTQALALDPTHDEYCAVLYCNRAAALMGLHQYENALHDCNAALRRKARYPRGLLRRARCNVALKRYAAAIADFDRYLKDTRVEEASSAGSFAEIEREKQSAEQAMEKEAQERKRQEEQQKKERQRNYGRAKSQQQQQQRRSSQQHAWDDSKFYEEFWRSSSTGGSSSSRNQQSSGGAKSNRGSAAAHNKHQRTHYEVLGITKSATQDEIKKAYRKLALLHHPDKAKDTVHADLFKDMTAAYSVLSDTTARAKYDRELQYSGYGRYYEY